MSEPERKLKPATSASLSRRVLIAIGLPIWVLVGFVLASLAVSFVNQALAKIGLLPAGAIDESLRSTIVASFIYILTLVIVIGVPLKLRGIKTTKEDLGLTKLPTWTDLALAPAAFIVYIMFAGILTIVISQYVPGFDAEQAQEVGFDSVDKYYEYALAFITLVVLAPVAEEILMRGYLYGKLRKIAPVIVAMLISSLLFSLMHFQWNVAVNVFPLAIILVVLRETTGSIWAGILLHMLKNGVAFYFLFINPLLLHTIGG